MPKRIQQKVGLEAAPVLVPMTLPDDEPAPYEVGEKRKVLSGRVPRKDGPAKVSGRARYTADVQLPGMLWGRIVRSPHPAARVVAVNLGPAKAMRGVHAALAFVGRRIFFAGEEVAAVAAESDSLAREAAERVEVKYEVLPFVTDTDAARRSGAPKVHDGGNLRPAKPTVKGDVGAAFKNAAAMVEGTFRTRCQTHTSLETHGHVASWKGDVLTLYASTQGIFATREGVASALQVPLNKVRVLTEHMGGGFGSKLGPTQDAVISARLAKEAKRPVRLVLDRKEEHLATGNRPDSVQKVRLAADKGGKITALAVDAYASPGVTGGGGTGRLFNVMYGIPNLDLTHTDVFTNLGPARPFRAPGHPQASFALEGAIDELAKQLDLDPLRIRLVNSEKDDVRTAELKLGAEKFDWAGREARRRATRAPLRRGFGLACAVWYHTGRPGMGVEVVITSDARVVVRSGSQDIGTGLRTVLAMVVADELGLTPDDVVVEIGDTTFLMGPGSGGSSTTPSLAPPARVAAHRALQKLTAIAAEALGVAPGDVAFADKVAASRSAPHKRVPWKRLCSRLTSPLVEKARRQVGYEAYTQGALGCQFAEVVVDAELGAIKVEKIVAVQDCGIPINRMTCESQIIGGVIQGVSYALLEERIVDHRHGKMLNANVEQYKIVGAADLPEIVPIVFDVAVGQNATSTVGIGEPPTVPTAAAIANAVADALGARVYELPMTPARVLAALRGAGAEKKP